MNEAIIILISAICGYLIGSIPFGLIVVKMAGLGDIRQIGSKNIGATNVLRTGRKDLAVLTLLFDMTKAGIASFIALKLSESEVSSFCAGSFAIVGHNFPVWLKFKGGKGVASTFGMMAVTCFPVGLLSGITWLVVALISRISSLSALFAIGFAPVYALFLGNKIAAFFYFLIAILIFIRHKENIKRLLEGKESKINFKSKKDESKSDNDS